MSNAKLWKVIELSDDYFYTTNHKYAIEGGDTGRIAKVEGFGPDCLAIAHLLSAAPDMLAALEAVEWSGHIGCPSCGCRRSAGHAAGCQLAAAIRKAKGDK